MNITHLPTKNATFRDWTYQQSLWSKHSLKGQELKDWLRRERVKKLIAKLELEQAELRRELA